MNKELQSIQEAYVCMLAEAAYSKMDIKHIYSSSEMKDKLKNLANKNKHTYSEINDDSEHKTAFDQYRHSQGRNIHHVVLTPKKGDAHHVEWEDDNNDMNKDSIIHYKE